MWLKNTLFHIFIPYSGRTLNLGKATLAMCIHKQFSVTEIDWQIKASDVEEPETLQVAYGCRLKNKCVLSQPKQGRYFSSSEMGPNTGQTQLDISMISEEPEVLAPVTRGETPPEQSLTYGAGRFSVAGVAARTCKEYFLRSLKK